MKVSIDISSDLKHFSWQLRQMFPDLRNREAFRFPNAELQVFSKSKDVRTGMGEGWYKTFILRLVRIKTKDYFVAILPHKREVYLYSRVRKHGKENKKALRQIFPYEKGCDSEKIVDSIKSQVLNSDKIEKAVA